MREYKEDKIRIIGARKNEKNEITFRIEFVDGKECLMKNEEMKDKYPHLLISYYENRIKWPSAQ